MLASTLIPSAGRLPLWLTAVALGGIAWNAFGALQFAGSITTTPESLVADGLTAEQAAIMTGYPVWMTIAFFVGVGGGLIGSVFLLAWPAAARPVLAVSLVAYALLWIGDAVHGVFAAMGTPQVVILTLVVAIAAALFAVAGLRSGSRT